MSTEHIIQTIENKLNKTFIKKYLENYEFVKFIKWIKKYLEYESKKDLINGYPIIFKNIRNGIK